MKTTEKLATALETAGAPNEMVVRARNGYYDDFLSPLALPISELVKDARRHNLAEIVNRAIDGDFDASSAESDAWAKSPDGRAAFAQLVGNDKP